MMWTQTEQQQVDDKLRSLLAEGRTIDEAIDHLHQVEHLGYLLILPSVVSVSGMEKREAMRLIARKSMR
jgi:hypothetical protein